MSTTQSTPSPIRLSLALSFLLVIASPMYAWSEVQVQRTDFGTTESGEPIDLFTLNNANGMQVQVMTYGATLVSVRVPDREGNLDDVNLRLDRCEDYLKGHPLFGSTVGRFANRIANAEFKLDGETYALTKNSGGNHIHGGATGFQKLNWRAESVSRDEIAGVRLTHTSPDGHEGYPGTLEVTVVYWLNESNDLTIDYTASTDRPTHINLTNHAYWNLAGIGSGDVTGHHLQINAASYLESGEKRIPTGQILPVAGTPFDFVETQTIGARLSETDGGYDHCYVIDTIDGRRLIPIATAYEPTSGRVMNVATTQPGVQLYTANGLSDRFSFDGKPYGKYHGFCLETQHYPDTPNHENFPTTVLRPGETFRETTRYSFGVRPL